jgi:hypothetical protein
MNRLAILEDEIWNFKRVSLMIIVEQDLYNYDFVFCSVSMRLTFRIISLESSVLYPKKDGKEIPISVIINKQNLQKEERGRLIY